MNTIRLLSVAFALLLAVLQARDSRAQTQRSGGEQQKFMQQYQQLAAEKTDLQAQLAQAKKDLDAAKADLAAMKKERDSLKTRPSGVAPATVAQLTSAKESAERNLEQSKQRTAELVARFRETATSLRDTEAERTKLRGELDVRNAAYDKCAENNQQLFDINGDILNRYDHVGVFTRVGADEPFSRITRTRMDNLVVETRARALELRVKQRPPPPP
jgi:chromosome segregation ATPase